MPKTKLSEPVKYLIIALALILFDKPNGIPINPPIKDIPIIEPIPNMPMNIKAVVSYESLQKS